LAFVPDSTILVTGASGGNVALWDAATGDKARQLQGPSDDYPSSFSFSPDGKTLAAGFSKNIIIWDITSGQLINTITLDLNPVRINSLAYSPNGKSLAIGTEIGALIIWDIAKNQPQASLIAYSYLSSLAFSPDGSLLATVSPGSPVVLWDTNRWVKRALITEYVQSGAASSLVFSPDGTILAITGLENTIDLWDVDHLVKLASIKGHSDFVLNLAYSPDGNILASGSSDQTVLLWDAHQVEPLQGTLAPTPTVMPDDVTYVFPQPFKPERPIAISGLHMIDKNIGWGFAPDGPYQSIDTKTHLLRTTDGGHTWRVITLPKESDTPGSFFALDANTAWTSPRYKMQADEKGVLIPYQSLYTWRTADGGQTWQQSQPFSLARQGLGTAVPDYSVDIQFLDQNNGWLLVNVDCQSRATCGWQFYQTADGGMNWKRMSDSEQATSVGALFSIGFWDEKTVWGAGSLIGWIGPFSTWNASLSKTSDGGRTWQDFPIPQPTELPEVFKNNGLDCGSVDIKYISFEAVGVTTQCMVYAGTSYPRYQFFHLTPDGGRTWHAWQTNGSESFVNAKTGWRLISPGVDEPTRLMWTTDSGAAWTEIIAVSWNGSLDFVSEQVGWAIARQAQAVALLHTTDGGKTWTEIVPEIVAR
jgi:photosystem II stability/assembly factor-like uncharacterized protein